MSITMEQKIKEFYEKEYISVFNWIHGTYCKNLEKRKEAINNAIQRCLGVAFFVQELDVPFAEIDAIYEKYRAKFYNLY